MKNRQVVGNELGVERILGKVSRRCVEGVTIQISISHRQVSERDEGERREGDKDISFAEDKHNAASVREGKKDQLRQKPYGT